MKIFNVILIIFIVLISVSTVNAVELNNVTDCDVLSLDVFWDNSTELLSEDEKISTLIQNNTISDFNNSEYAINGTDLSCNFINLDTNNINYNSLNYSISNVQYGNFKSNSLSTSSGTVNLIKTNTYTPIYNNNLNSVNPTQIKYDLRNDGYVSSVKDQKDVGNCWAYATLSALESCILKATGVEYDFSELMLSRISNEYKPGNGEGGSMSMSMGYINSWLGAVKEKLW